MSRTSTNLGYTIALTRVGKENLEKHNTPAIHHTRSLSAVKTQLTELFTLVLISVGFSIKRSLTSNNLPCTPLIKVKIKTQF